VCGIVGIISKTPVQNRILQGLKRLEYRGYDSAGIATISDEGLKIRKTAGKIINLEQLLKKSSLNGTIGIGHTRWATHGVPNEINAHPHRNDLVAIIHNGIIENHKTLKAFLVERGYSFISDTDTEAVLHLTTHYLQQGNSPYEAVKKTLTHLKGAYALVFLFKDYPDLLIGARSGSPLAVGYGQNEMFLGSDAIALADLTSEVSYLEEGDIVVLSHDNVKFYDKDGKEKKRATQKKNINLAAISKGPYDHFMLKEIFDQPDVLRYILSHYLNPTKTNFLLPLLPFLWKDVPKITIVACGTAYYAGLVAKYWFEKMAGIPVEIDIASEFRYRTPPLPQNGVALFISQSGETADTMAAFSYAKSQKQHCIGIVNVAESSLARLVDTCLFTHAGPEIGVASTKAFTAQLTVLAILALSSAHARGHMKTDELETFCCSLALLPEMLNHILDMKDQVKMIAQMMAKNDHALYLGRGTSFAIALEGALKLKEISYIHAEGCAAGEIKHGPIALVDKNMPVVMIVPHDDLFEKAISNVQEINARQGKIILLSDEEGHQNLIMSSIERLELPATNPLTAPIAYSIPVQLIAYYCAVARGTDVDQPRNLAKSVTVE
jgi:glucosamine--fructose-6-phosphate aminotransferase (isomerizing)